MTEQRRVTIYECKDGYLVHDADSHMIYLYKNCDIEKIVSNKTVIEVLDEL